MLGKHMRTVAAGLLASLAIVAPAHAVDFHVASDTIGQGYQLITSSGEVLKRSRIHQMLGLNIYDMTGDGTNSISFVSQLRFNSDFGITDIETANIPQLKNNNFSILYAYFEMKGLLPYIDMRLGRQLLIDDSDFTMMDGALFTVHTGFHLAVEVYAGIEVKDAGFLGVISDTQLEVDGAGGFDDEEDEKTGIVVGGALLLEGIRDHHAKIGYRRIFTAAYTDPILQQESVFVDSERVFANYHIRVIENLHLSAAASYDLVNGVFADIRVGARAPRIAGVLDIEAYYWHLTPTFEGSSIFNVFSSKPMNDIDMRVRYHFGEGISGYLGGYVRLLENDKDDNDDDAVAEGITDVGLRGGARFEVRPWWIGFDGSHQFGVSELTTIDAFGGYRFLNQTLEVTGRVTTLIYDDPLIENLQGVSFGGQVGLAYRISDLAKFHLVSELNTNRIESLQFRLYGLVDLDFWL
ncbi:MAG: hypothetical protein ACI9OJ_001697 [Myxococcota bacterium]|jgi:hypothetical protein